MQKIASMHIFSIPKFELLQRDHVTLCRPTLDSPVPKYSHYKQASAQLPYHTCSNQLDSNMITIRQRCECCCCIKCDMTHASESSHSLCLSVVQHLLSMIEGAHHYTLPFECSLAVLEPTTCNRNVQTYTSRSTISRHARTRHPHCIARLPASSGSHCRHMWPAKLAFLEQFRRECSWQSEWSGA